MDLLIRPMTGDDVEVLVAAFALLGWPGKDAAQFRGYIDEVTAGTHVWLVAAVDGEVAGYGGLEWTSGYAPFAEDGVPQVVDLNVLPSWRNRGIAGRLLDALEARAGERSDVIGLGVGLYADYAAAWRLYLRRGYLPDGAGVVYQEVPVAPGTTVRLDDDAEMKLTRRLR